jgi:Transposase and inactivated derivatives
MTNPNRARRRFTPQQKEEAVALCLAEGLTCTAVAQRLGIPVSSLAKWVRQPVSIAVSSVVPAKAH